MALEYREFKNGQAPAIDSEFLNGLQQAILDGSTGAIELTEAEYEALSEEEKAEDKLYMISDGTPIDRTAENIAYDNTDSGLNATNVQDAIDEITKDFIIEQGVASGWNYTKWNSGRVELYSTYDYTITSGYITSRLPFVITDPIYWCNIVYRSGTDYLSSTECTSTPVIIAGSTSMTVYIRKLSNGAFTIPTEKYVKLNILIKGTLE